MEKSAMMENIQDSVIECIGIDSQWQEFLQYKLEKNNLNRFEKETFIRFIDNKRYLDMKKKIDGGKFPGELPKKSIINKEGTSKKRVVYTFSEDINITLKFIAYKLYKFDEMFEYNCYAFRRNTGVNNALRRILRNPELNNNYCLKVDISNYFNSIKVDRLLEMLDEIKVNEYELYKLFEKILKEPRVIENDKCVEEEHGAMAGIPLSPFFAKDFETLCMYQKELYGILKCKGLMINKSKEIITEPGHEWEFLGFKYFNCELDLSENTKRKIKAKIKRKARSLRRWSRKKGLTYEKAAKGFIKAMNRKFFGCDGDDEFTWSKWFFPNITVDSGLKEIDAYMQEYIRYIITGRHYKGNYRIKYDQLKEWGYRNLVNEYYKL